MLTINGKFYSKEDFDKRADALISENNLKRIENKTLAVCLIDPLLILNMVKFSIQNNNSILLIHPETPLVYAREIARENKAYMLFHHERSGFLLIESDHSGTDNPGLLQFTSGTTGKPKLINRTWKEIDEEVYYYNKKLPADVPRASVILVPVNHSYGLVAGVLATLKRGYSPVIVTGKNPKLMIRIIRDNPDSIVYGTPFIFHLLQSFDKKDIYYNRIVSSGAPIDNKLLDSLKKCSGHVMQQYGSTETGCISFNTDAESGSDVGTPLDHYKIKIDKPGSTGEILINYNGEIIHTNDLGYLDEQGALHLLGRCDDLINVGGQKVIPYEVEKIIYKLDNVKEVVVFKTQHPLFGEAVKALVVPEKDAENISEDNIKQWCKKYLPSFKVPRSVGFAGQLPRNPNGKINREQLV